jgi:hypothetical protein
MPRQLKLVRPAPGQVKIDDFSFVRHEQPLHAVAGKLHSVRFRNRPIAPIFVEFECGGKWYRVEVTNNATATDIIGKLWLQSHHESCKAKNQRRRDKAAAFREHLKSASRTVKTWPKWKQELLEKKK